MTFDEMDEMWHRIREEHAAEDAGLSIEERVARDNALAKEAAERLGLRIVTAADLKKTK